MTLQGFDKDTKQCLQKGGSSLTTPEKQASFFFKSLPQKLMLYEMSLNHKHKWTFSAFLEHTALLHTEYIWKKMFVFFIII